MGASWILDYVIPWTGVLIGNAMFAAPWKDVLYASQTGDLGDLNPLPWTFMTGVCYGWTCYGVISQQLPLLLGAAPGLLLSLWLNMQAVKLQYARSYSDEMRKILLQDSMPKESSSTELTKDVESSGSENDPKTRGVDPPGFDPSNSARRVIIRRNRTYTYDGLSVLDEQNVVEDLKNEPEEDEENGFDLVIYNVHSNLQKIKTTASQENVLLWISTMWMAVTLFIAFKESLDKDAKLLIVGVIVNANFVIFYGAPLSTIYTVITTRATATIHIPTMLLNTLNGGFWGVYGITVNNLFVILPNGLGVVLGIVQIILVLILPRYPKSEDGTDIRSSRRTLFILTTDDLEPSMRKSLSRRGSRRGTSLITDPNFYQGKTERLWL